MRLSSLLAVANSLVIAALLMGFSQIGQAAPGFTGKVGLQLYSLREEFKKDVPGTLDKVKSWGIKDVELAGTYGMSPTDFRAELDKRGLKGVSGHFAYERFRDDAEGVAKEAKELGLEYVGTAYITHKGKFDETQCRDTIKVFNHAGDVMAKHGMKFFYHTHGFEFEPYKDETIFDLLVKETNPKTVSFEMDILWVYHPGQDPVKFLKKYGKRWQLTHLKDLRKGLPIGPKAPGVSPNDNVVLGEGQMDIPAILKAAQKAGVKYNFIEDESNRSEQQIPLTLKYLKEIKL
jgi:sugar phosphate isomerase/epimerase